MILFFDIKMFMSQVFIDSMLKASFIIAVKTLVALRFAALIIHMRGKIPFEFIFFTAIRFRAGENTRVSMRVVKFDNFNLEVFVLETQVRLNVARLI